MSAAQTLAGRGLIDTRAAEALLAEVAQSGIETIRVLFVDPHGILRGKTVVADALASVLARGLAVPSTLLLKDTSHRTAFPVWSADAGVAAGPMQGAGDVLLLPDPVSFHRLPWAPHSAMLLCDVAFRDGMPVPFAPRAVLRRAVGQLADAGLSARIGLEVEFHVFRVENPRLAHDDATMPPRPPDTALLTRGHQYLTEARYGAAEPVLDTLRRHAQAMGLPVRSVEVEMGPSQFEFTFEPADPMRQAEAFVLFRTLVKQVCAAEGLHASFMPRPVLANASACGWHIHQSLTDADGRNVFVPGADGTPGGQAGGWIAGLLAHARESCLLTSPTVNGYKRYRPHQLAPTRVAWGHDNRGAMLRALLAPGDPASRVENRAPDTAANPYFALAAQILSGLAGVEAGLEPPPPSATPYDDDGPALPATLGEAIDAFERSGLYRAALGDGTVDWLVTLKRAEWDRYLAALSAWEQAEYFDLF